MKNTVYLCALAALASGTLTVQAQTYQTPVSLPGVPGVVTYNGVPEGFDPASASASELEEYGFPPRPEISDAQRYASWLRAASMTRITPVLTVTGRYHRPNQVISKTSVPGSGTVKDTSGNWSGYSLVGGSPIFTEVAGLWVVPSVNNQSESIDGYMSEWVGIDGNCKCDDLVQNGTSQIYLKGKTTYNSWFEYIPESEVEVSNFSIAPGDVIKAYSWVTEKSGKIYGNYYLANYNTKRSWSASLPTPAKTSFSGLSTEWIVERTQVNGNFNNPLPDYAYAYMADAVAYRNGSSRAIPYTDGSNEQITMAQGSTKLSTAFEQDASSIWFEWLNY